MKLLKTNNINDGYLGSGSVFVKAIKKYGKENFHREILEFCSSYDELIEKEKIYFDENWIEDYSNYNLKTGGQSAGILSKESRNKISESLKEGYKSGKIKPVKRDHSPLSDELKQRISKTLRDKWKNGEIDTSNMNKWELGNSPWNKGLTYEGIKLGPMTEEEKQKRSKTLKERYKNQVHHSKGKDPWNKGKKGVQVAWNKGKEMEKIECPHCGKLVDKLNAKKWHFDNCKTK